MTITIGVAVPCYKYHLGRLRSLLDSIERQIRKPDAVVVSCSSMNSGENHGIDCTTYSFPLQIITTTERKNAAQNRNIAAAALRTTIVSFFDADDIMTSERLRYIEFAFQNYPCLFVVHNFSEKEETTPNNFPLCTYGKLRRSDLGNGIRFDSDAIDIHHSQASVVATVLSKIKYREDAASERKEDSFFCRDVLEYVGIANVYIANKLSIYYPEGQWY